MQHVGTAELSRLDAYDVHVSPKILVTYGVYVSPKILVAYGVHVSPKILGAYDVHVSPKILVVYDVHVSFRRTFRRPGGRGCREVWGRVAGRSGEALSSLWSDFVRFLGSPGVTLGSLFRSFCALF